MKYRFLAVHKLIGVTRPTERDEETIIVEYPSLKARVLLTYNIDEHLFELDRASVVALMMLKGLIGQGGEGTFEERLRYELSEFRDRRQKEIGGGVCVLPTSPSLPALYAFTQVANVDGGKDSRRAASGKDNFSSVTSFTASSRNSFVYLPCGIPFILTPLSLYFT